MEDRPTDTTKARARVSVLNSQPKLDRCIEQEMYLGYDGKNYLERKRNAQKHRDRQMMEGNPM